MKIHQQRVTYIWQRWRYTQPRHIQQKWNVYPTTMTIAQIVTKHSKQQCSTYKLDEDTSKKMHTHRHTLYKNTQNDNNSYDNYKGVEQRAHLGRPRSQQIHTFRFELKYFFAQLFDASETCSLAILDETKMQQKQVIKTNWRKLYHKNCWTTCHTCLV